MGGWDKIYLTPGAYHPPCVPCERASEAWLYIRTPALTSHVTAHIFAEREGRAGVINQALQGRR